VTLDRLVANPGLAPKLPLACALAPREVDHQRNVRSVEVGVEEADGETFACQGKRDMQSDRRLPDAALSTPDGDDESCRSVVHELRVARPATMSSSADVSAGTARKRSCARVAASSASLRAPDSP
jgi:hypothetical protein